MVARPARWKLVMSAGGLALLAAGCGSGGSSGSTPAGGSSSPAASSPASSAPPTSPGAEANSALCADAAALRASVDKLRHITVGAGTASEIAANLREVKTALTTFIQDAHGQWQAQTSALSSAIATLSTAVSSLTASPGVGTVSGVVAALGGVSTAAQNLLAAVNPSCLSASASPSA